MKTNWRAVTKGILVALFLLLVVWDVFVYAVAGNPPTISRVFLAWASDYPILAIAFGVLLGHLFVPQHITAADQKSTFSR